MTEQYFEDNVVKFKFIQVHLWQKICKSLLQRNQTVKGLKGYRCISYQAPLSMEG